MEYLITDLTAWASTQHAKRRTCHLSALSLPHFSALSLPVQAMHERNQARRLWQRRKVNYLYDRYKLLRNKTQDMIRAAKKGYYLEHFSRTNRACEIWDGLRRLSLIRVRNSSVRLMHTVEELISSLLTMRKHAISGICEYLSLDF